MSVGRGGMAWASISNSLPGGGVHPIRSNQQARRRRSRERRTQVISSPPPVHQGTSSHCAHVNLNSCSTTTTVVVVEPKTMHGQGVKSNNKATWSMAMVRWRWWLWKPKKTEYFFFFFLSAWWMNRTTSNQRASEQHCQYTIDQWEFNYSPKTETIDHHRHRLPQTSMFIIGQIIQLFRSSPVALWIKVICPSKQVAHIANLDGLIVCSLARQPPNNAYGPVCVCRFPHPITRQNLLMIILHTSILFKCSIFHEDNQNDNKSEGGWVDGWKSQWEMSIIKQNIQSRISRKLPKAMGAHK